MCMFLLFPQPFVVSTKKKMRVSKHLYKLIKVCNLGPILMDKTRQTVEIVLKFKCSRLVLRHDILVLHVCYHNEKKWTILKAILK